MLRDGRKLQTLNLRKAAMNRTLLLAAAVASLVIAAKAALKPGDRLTAYNIKNVETGAVYCQL